MTTKLVEIFRAGKPRTDSSGRGYDAAQIGAMLADAAATYDPAKHLAPFLEGHDESKPNRGLVKRVLQIGQSLFAEPFGVDEGFKDEVNRGGWPALSSAFYSPDDARNPTPGRWALRHVAAVQIPAVKGMTAPQFGEPADDVLAFAFMEPQVMSYDVAYLAEITGTALGNIRDLMIESVGIEKVNAALSADLVGQLMALANELRQNPSIVEADQAALDFSEGTTMSDDLNKDLAARAAELDAREAAIALKEIDAERAEFSAFCEGLLTEGKQFDKDAAIATYMALPTAPVQFGEGTKSPRDIYRGQLSALPKIVEFGEIAGADGATGDLSAAEIAVQARAIVADAKAAGQIVSFTEAVNQIEARA